MKCPKCQGDGWTLEVREIHHSECTGTCVQCPIEEQYQEQCSNCQGTGQIPDYEEER